MQFLLLFLLIVIKKCPGKLHIVLDGWTAPNVISYLGVIVYYVRNGKMESFTLDFIKYVLLIFYYLIDTIVNRLVKGHTGKYLAIKLLECLEHYEIHRKACVEVNGIMFLTYLVGSDYCG